MANIVRSIAGDVRVGRLLFGTELADPVVVRKRSESAALLAALLGQHGQQALGLPDDERLKATSHFAVGGVGQAITAWLTGQVAFTQDELIDQLAWCIDPAQPPPGLTCAGTRRSAAVFGSVLRSAWPNSFTQQANSSAMPSGS